MELGHVQLSLIRENPEAMRGVDKANEDYIELVDSVNKNGVLQPIQLRELYDAEGQPVKDDKGNQLYGIVNGHQRFAASLDSGKETIPATINNLTDEDVESQQIQLNAVTVMTKAIDYARGIQLLLKRDPSLTLEKIGAKISKSATWVSKTLRLLSKLNPELEEDVNEGRICVSNAQELCRLPLDEQLDWRDRAKTTSAPEFAPQVVQRKKEIDEARRKGEKESPPEFKPQAANRKWAEIKAEFESPSIGKKLLAELNCTSAEAAWNLAVAWACKMDPVTQKQQKEAHELRQKEKADRDERKQLERAKKQEDEAKAVREKLEKKLAAAE